MSAATAIPEAPSYKGYAKWLLEEHDVTVNNRLRNRYETVAATIQRTVADSGFWKAALANLSEFDAEYQVAQGYRLLDPSHQPELLTKPFESFLHKTYRRNISQNPLWPDPPVPGGWVIPLAGLPAISDVVRTTFVVKYLDGVSFLVEKLDALATTHRIEFRADFEAKEEGYYAAHAYVTRAFEVPAAEWDTEILNMSIELQVTTQIQDLIKKLLHTYYEQNRARSNTQLPQKWQWNYKSEEFAANYLGHILHYVEGMIMDIRDKQRPGASG